jgi:hypothetical protein
MAWFGHEKGLTTFWNYGNFDIHQRAEIILRLSH